MSLSLTWPGCLDHIASPNSHNLSQNDLYAYLYYEVRNSPVTAPVWPCSRHITVAGVGISCMTEIVPSYEQQAILDLSSLANFTATTEFLC